MVVRGGVEPDPVGGIGAAYIGEGVRRIDFHGTGSIPEVPEVISRTIAQVRKVHRQRVTALQYRGREVGLDGRLHVDCPPDLVAAASQVLSHQSDFEVQSCGETGIHIAMYKGIQGIGDGIGSVPKVPVIGVRL